eukprot:scaffold1881_cov181-Ochromonas_danica.AAC.24
MVDRDSLLREVESTFRLVTSFVLYLPPCSLSLSDGYPPSLTLPGRSRGVIVNGDWLSQCLDHVLCRYPASASSVVGVSEKSLFNTIGQLKCSS